MSLYRFKSFVALDLRVLAPRARKSELLVVGLGVTTTFDDRRLNREAVDHGSGIKGVGDSAVLRRIQDVNKSNS